MVETSSARAAIQAELVALAEKHIAAFDGYTVVVDDHAKKHHAKYTTESGNRLTVAKFHCPGLTHDKIKAFYDNVVENTGKMNSKITMTKIGQDGANNIYHALAKCPFPLSNRSSITCEYKIEHDGVLTFIQSSRGNEALTTANASIIGKNVVAISIINFARFTPVTGGYDITTVTCADPAGSIPDGMKNK